MQVFFAITLFVSATLLFVVQPMFAKMVLPLLGGTPSVWNTCMVFYQAALLGGYVYAHLTTRWLGPRRQAMLHLAVLCLPWIVLPISVAGIWTPPADANPVPWLLMLMAMSVGLPFFVVSASAPLLQTWFAGTGHPAGKDPYFLYAASNLGSMIALLGYPLLMEPNLPLAGQTTAWAAGYGLLMLLTAACAVLLWRSNGRLTESTEIEAPDASADLSDKNNPTFRRRMWWLVLSFVPSSLLLGVTTHISTDITVVPLLWVIPLALYLLTFVLVFARRTILPHTWMIRLQPYLIILLAALFFHGAAKLIWVLLPLHLVTFFVIAMVCHGELAQRRPNTTYLTEFYLWMSLGGVLGGLFNAMIAPTLFPWIVEYPMVIAVACLLRPSTQASGTARQRWLDVGLPLVVALSFFGLVRGIEASGAVLSVSAASVILGLVGLIAFSCQERPVRFGLGVAALMFVGLTCFGKEDNVLSIERNFFGVVRVKYEPKMNMRMMYHGSTNHGMQSLDPESAGQPLAYYHRQGPLGQAIRATGEVRRPSEIGVIGLGTGSIASYGESGQRMIYFEIDPAVERIARDTRYFTFLRDSKADVTVRLGDARLTMADEPDGRFDLLILDAFSSDAIPIHLITREAIELYLSKLADDGVLALHISNRYLDLEPVLGNLAADADLVCRIGQDSGGSKADQQSGRFGCRWVVMSRRAGPLGTLLTDPRWKPLRTRPTSPVWTDDFSNILTAMNWW